MKAVVTVIGKDNVGIIAKVSAGCAEFGANILEISQSVLNIMLVDISALTLPFAEFVDRMTAIGQKNALEIHTMHEEVFSSMHRV